ncbi:MAG: GntR family transcriptional regulator [Caulobacterales bacterium]
MAKAKESSAKARPRKNAGSLSLVAHDAPVELQKARAYELILIDIILGELAPGSQLDEKALAIRYNSGLAGIRDALSRLSLEGLVDRRPRAGTFVSPLDVVELQHDYEARRIIEPECAALAARYGSTEDIQAIKDAFKGGEAAAKACDCRALIRMDQRFHAAIARASNNSSLARILIPLQHKAARFWVFSMGQASLKERIADVRAHVAIGACIADRDPEGAYRAMLAAVGEPPATARPARRA